jgi:hypothetical protein
MVAGRCGGQGGFGGDVCGGIKFASDKRIRVMCIEDRAHAITESIIGNRQGRRKREDAAYK